MQFASAGGTGWSDKEKVVISANLGKNIKEFDIAVGLALHEGSHIKLSDFEKARPDYILDKCKKQFKGSSITGRDKGVIGGRIKELLNYVEDRRVDNYIYKSAPGYQGYYNALYDKYFHSKIVDKGLRSQEGREENWEDYMFRIINLTNVNRDLDALKGLRQIWKTLDLVNIERLKDTEDALDLAINIYDIINGHVEKANGNKSEDQQPENNKEENGDAKDLSGNKDGVNADSPLSSNVIDGKKTDSSDDDKSQGGDADDNNSSETTKKTDELTDKQKKELKKQIQKQIDFSNGNIKKSKLATKYNEQINTADASAMTYVQTDANNLGGTEVLVIKNFSRETIKKDFLHIFQRNDCKIKSNQININKGLALGTRLGNKLQIRRDERDTKFTRLDKGKIDRRLISELGFNNSRVFHKIETLKYKPVTIHISIDASGSMHGENFENAQVCAVAIAKACSMIGNIHCVISYRMTADCSNCMIPVVLIAYDSSKDKTLTKISNLFKHIVCTGTTPEGLCFEAIMKEIKAGDNNTESYFVNLSDGMPTFYSGQYHYGGSYAEAHTRKQVQKMKEKGIKIISYFVADTNINYNLDKFKKMYGADAVTIDPTNISAIAKTMNKKFLEVA